MLNRLNTGTMTTNSPHLRQDRPMIPVLLQTLFVLVSITLLPTSCQAFSPPSRSTSSLLLSPPTNSPPDLPSRQHQHHTHHNMVAAGGLFGGIKSAARAVLPKRWTTSDTSSSRNNKASSRFSRHLLSSMSLEEKEQYLMDSARNFMLTDPEVKEALGLPILVQRPPSQSMASKKSKVTFPVKGALREGVVAFTATGPFIQNLSVQVDDGQTIQVVTPEPEDMYAVLPNSELGAGRNIFEDYDDERYDERYDEDDDRVQPSPNVFGGFQSPQQTTARTEPFGKFQVAQPAARSSSFLDGRPAAASKPKTTPVSNDDSFGSVTEPPPQQIIPNNSDIAARGVSQSPASRSSYKQPPPTIIPKSIDHDVFNGLQQPPTYQPPPPTIPKSIDNNVVNGFQPPPLYNDVSGGEQPGDDYQQPPEPSIMNNVLFDDFQQPPPTSIHNNNDVVNGFGYNHVSADFQQPGNDVFADYQQQPEPAHTDHGGFQEQEQQPEPSMNVFDELQQQHPTSIQNNNDVVGEFQSPERTIHTNNDVSGDYQQHQPASIQNNNDVVGEFQSPERTIHNNNNDGDYQQQQPPSIHSNNNVADAFQHPPPTSNEDVSYGHQMPTSINSSNDVVGGFHHQEAPTNGDFQQPEPTSIHSNNDVVNGFHQEAPTNVSGDFQQPEPTSINSNNDVVNGFQQQQPEPTINKDVGHQQLEQPTIPSIQNNNDVVGGFQSSPEPKNVSVDSQPPITASSAETTNISDEVQSSSPATGGSSSNAVISETKNPEPTSEVSEVPSSPTASSSNYSFGKLNSKERIVPDKKKESPKSEKTSSNYSFGRRKSKERIVPDEKKKAPKVVSSPKATASSSNDKSSKKYVFDPSKSAKAKARNEKKSTKKYVFDPTQMSSQPKSRSNGKKSVFDPFKSSSQPKPQNGASSKKSVFDPFKSSQPQSNPQNRATNGPSGVNGGVYSPQPSAGPGGGGGVNSNDANVRPPTAGSDVFGAGRGVRKEVFVRKPPQEKTQGSNNNNAYDAFRSPRPGTGGVNSNDVSSGYESSPNDEVYKRDVFGTAHPPFSSARGGGSKSMFDGFQSGQPSGGSNWNPDSMFDSYGYDGYGYTGEGNYDSNSMFDGFDYPKTNGYGDSFDGPQSQQSSAEKARFNECDVIDVEVVDVKKTHRP